MASSRFLPFVAALTFAGPAIATSPYEAFISVLAAKPLCGLEASPSDLQGLAITGILEKGEIGPDAFGKLVGVDLTRKIETTDAQSFCAEVKTWEIFK